MIMIMMMIWWWYDDDDDDDDDDDNNNNNYYYYYVIVEEQYDDNYDDDDDINTYTKIFFRVLRLPVFLKCEACFVWWYTKRFLATYSRYYIFVLFS